MVAGFVMLRGLPMMSRCVIMMLGCLVMMFCRLLGHESSSSTWCQLRFYAVGLAGRRVRLASLTKCQQSVNGRRSKRGAAGSREIGGAGLPVAGSDGNQNGVTSTECKAPERSIVSFGFGFW